MNERQSILCPNCRKLISGYLSECPHCGLKSPSQKQKFYRFIGMNRQSFVKAIIIINVAYFVISYLLPFVLPASIPSGRGAGGLLPSPGSTALNLLGWAEIGAVQRGNWWVLITATFLHGGILHILFNMLWVRDLGPQTEILFSPHKMLIIYIFSGVGGNIAAIYTPVFAREFLRISMMDYPVIGASGAVFGLMGAIIAFGRKRGGFWGRQLVRQLGMWAAILMFMGFIFPGISNAGHIGGFISGFVIGQLMPLRNKASSNGFFVVLGAGTIVLCGYAFFRMFIRLVSILASI